MKEDYSSDKYSQDDASNLYVVQTILSKKFIKKNGKDKPYYLIKWQGYSQEEDQTWQPIENLTSVKKMLQQFEESLKNKTNYQQPKERQNTQKTESYQQIKHMENKKRNRPAQNQQDILKSKLSKKSSHQTSFKRKDQKDKQEYYFSENNKRQQKLIKKKSEYSQLQIKKTSQSFKDQFDIKPKQKLSQYGKIINHIYENGQLIYEIQKLNKDRKPIQTIFLPSQRTKQECSLSLNEYLQRYLIQLQQYNNK